MDFHRNVFYYYRGLNTEKDGPDRQIEDNTTKALINTLEHGGVEVVASFLNWLGLEADERPRFYLQRSLLPEISIRKKKHRILLALLPKPWLLPPDDWHAVSVEKGRRGEEDCHDDLSKGDSRPDAWIVGKNFAVLIESKVLAYVDPKQLEIHFRKLEGGDTPPKFIERTWPEIHGFFLDLSFRLQGQEAWLVQQFSEYMELIGMNEFSGFRKDFFDYFFTRDDEDTRKWVRHNMKAFAGRISEEISKTIPFYQDFDAGRLTLADDHCWAAFGSNAGGNFKAYRNLAHQTITAGSQGLEILVNIELKPAVEKLRKGIRSNRSEWRNILLQIHNSSPFCLKIAERVKKQVQIYDYRQVCEVDSAYLSDHRFEDTSFNYLESLLEEIPLPYVTFTTSSKFLKKLYK